MSRPNYLSEIKRLIANAKAGTVFVAVDFVNITDKKTVSMGLTRLETDGLIRRVLRGVYYKPEYSGLSGKAGSSFYQGNPGQSRFRDPERLYPWLPFLSGGYGVPSDQRKKRGAVKRTCT